MSILIDTSALIAARNAEDRNHKSAVNNMNSALKGEYGKVFTSDYVFDEIVTLAYMRTGKKIFALDIGLFARSRPITMRFVEPIDFDRAWELYRQYDDKNLSFTDCTNIALMERLDIESIFTFDSEFKGIVNVI